MTSSKKNSRSNCSRRGERRTVPAKRKRTVAAKPEYQEAALERCSLHWTQRIEPQGGALLAQNLIPAYLMFKIMGQTASP